MIVLDADSLMTGPTMVHLVELMAESPRVGLIQTVSYAAGRDTLFARVQQFAVRLYAPLALRCLETWQGPHGSYWGHNAIVRVDAFSASARLPALPGRAPLGGEILCHDIVEGALLVRAGWEVRLLPEMPGTWEEMPTNPRRSARPRAPLVPGQPATPARAAVAGLARRQPLAPRRRHPVVRHAADLDPVPRARGLPGGGHGRPRPAGLWAHRCGRDRARPRSPFARDPGAAEGPEPRLRPGLGRAACRLRGDARPARERRSGTGRLVLPLAGDDAVHRRRPGRDLPRPGGPLGDPGSRRPAGVVARGVPITGRRGSSSGC